MYLCEACGGTLGPALFEISDLPLVDSFCPTPLLSAEVPKVSISVRQCNNCSTIQIASPPDTSEIYKNYIYESSSSPDLENHFAKFAAFVSDLVVNKESPILEIGANDGLLLSHLAVLGFNRLVAVDPSPQTASIQLEQVEVVNDFFSSVSMQCYEIGSFSTIIANNCFSHIPRLSDALKLCAKLLHQDGSVIVEVQSTLDLVEGVVFDYIYHEHYFYHSATSFAKLAGFSGLEVYSIHHVDTKGGSYRFLLGHPGQHLIDGSVRYWAFREEVAGLHSIVTWRRLQTYLQQVRAWVHDWVASSNTAIFGYGACATGTVFLNYMGLDTAISAIVDDNVKRQGLFAPGTSIPVLALDQVSEGSRCLLLAWRHRSLIIPKLRKMGVPSLTPLPSVIIDV